MGFLIAITAGFASGVFLRSLFIFSWQPMVFALLLATIFFVVPKILSAYSSTPFERESSSFLMGLGAVFCLFLALGMLRFAISESPLSETFSRDLHKKVTYTGIVVADPDMRDANQRIHVRVSKDSVTTNILVVTSRSKTIAVGDTVSVTGVLLMPEPFGDNGRIFRYDKYLERDGVRFIMNYALVRVLDTAPWYSIPAALARVKHAFIDGLTATLPEPYASLAGGITIGGKSGLGNELKDAFTRSSLIHIIVLSGYNVMIVAEWMMAALAFTTLRKRWAVAAGILALILFVGIAGATATAIRASLMAVIALYARATGRTYAAGRALLFAIFLMLVWNPLYLVFDPGFGLSVVATAGLIWLAPLIEQIWERMAEWRRIKKSSDARRGAAEFRREFISGGVLQGTTEEVAGPRNKADEAFGYASFWKNVVATTLAAQTAVLPLLLYNTGNLSLVAIPTNLLVVPLVPFAMGLSALAGFAGMLFSSFAPMIGIALAYPSYLANAYLIYVAEKAADLPFAAVTLPSFPFWLVLSAYAALVFIASSKRFSTTLQLRFAKNAST